MAKVPMGFWAQFWRRHRSRARRLRDEERERQNRLRILGIRTKPLPPPLPPRLRRFTDMDIDSVERAEHTQHMCSLITRLPREIRRLIYSEVLAGRNLLVRLRTNRDPVTWAILPDRLIHGVSSNRGSSDLWKHWYSTSCCFWPWDYNEDFTPILPLLQTCRAIYNDAIDIPYSLNNFLFRDPYVLLSLSMQVSRPRLDNIRHIFLKWEINGNMWEIDPLQRATWFDLWQTLAKFLNLKELKINIPNGKPLPWNTWTHDLWWVDPIKLVTAPSDFELLVPVDMAVVALDMSPTACRVIGHPEFSAPAILS